MDARAKAYDLASFRAWRGSLGEEGCRKAMKKLYKAQWTENEDALLEEWLGEG